MNSFIGWIGGKKLLRDKIVERFPEVFDRYIEVFGGAGWIMFHKERHAKMEVYNDINSDLVNLFYCVKNCCDNLQKELELILNSREMFSDYKDGLRYDGLSDIKRAAAFFYLVTFSYGSNARDFGCVKRFAVSPVVYLKEVQKRLNRVVIENKGYDNLIKAYDREAVLFYCDPPYYGSEKQYKDHPFTQDDHIRLCEILKGIKGRFILSYNDCDFIRELYKDFRIEGVSRNSNLTGRYATADHVYKELIMTNY